MTTCAYKSNNSGFNAPERQPSVEDLPVARCHHSCTYIGNVSGWLGENWDDERDKYVLLLVTELQEKRSGTGKRPLHNGSWKKVAAWHMQQNIFTIDSTLYYVTQLNISSSVALSLQICSWKNALRPRAPRFLATISITVISNWLAYFRCQWYMTALPSTCDGVFPAAMSWR